MLALIYVRLWLSRRCCRFTTDHHESSSVEVPPLLCLSLLSQRSKNPLNLHYWFSPISCFCPSMQVFQSKSLRMPVAWWVQTWKNTLVISGHLINKLRLVLARQRARPPVMSTITKWRPMRVEGNFLDIKAANIFRNDTALLAWQIFLKEV